MSDNLVSRMEEITIAVVCIFVVAALCWDIIDRYNYRRKKEREAVLAAERHRRQRLVQSLVLNSEGIQNNECPGEEPLVNFVRGLTYEEKYEIECLIRREMEKDGGELRLFGEIATKVE